jgi:hypothetical protein
MLCNANIGFQMVCDRFFASHFACNVDILLLVYAPLLLWYFGAKIILFNQFDPLPNIQGSIQSQFSTQNKSNTKLEIFSTVVDL